MISKELLSEITGHEISVDENDKPKIVFKTELEYYEKSVVSRYRQRINIYELAHKCKEWALGKGYIIEVGVHPTIKKDRSDRDYFYKITTDRGQILVSKFDEIIKTEPEAIFKACEWILKEKK